MSTDWSNYEIHNAKTYTILWDIQCYEIYNAQHFSLKRSRFVKTKRLVDFYWLKAYRKLSVIRHVSTPLFSFTLLDFQKSQLCSSAVNTGVSFPVNNINSYAIDWRDCQSGGNKQLLFWIWFSHQNFAMKSQENLILFIIEKKCISKLAFIVPLFPVKGFSRLFN